MDKILISGRSNKPLTISLAQKNNIPIAEVEIENFANMEKRIRILTPLQGKHVYIVQSTIKNPDEYIIELALLGDAAKRAGAQKISAIIPWFGYSPQDKVFREGEPLSSHVVTKMLESVGIDEFLVLDIHSPLVIQNFKLPITNHSAMPLFINYFKTNIKDVDNWVAVSVDKGSRERAGNFAENLNLPIVEFDKSRDLTTGLVTFHKLHGDVYNKNVIAFDDFVSTGGTIFQSAEYMKKLGALQYHFCVTHVVVADTLKKLKTSFVDKLITTNSIHFNIDPLESKIEILDLASVLIL